MENLKKGFVHTVFFWLKNPDNQTDSMALLEGLKRLSTIEEIKTAYIGTAADTRREVIDSSYSYSITFVFDSAKDQDVYQTHEQHLEFINNCSHLWQKVQVYDSYAF